MVPLPCARSAARSMPSSASSSASWSGRLAEPASRLVGAQQHLLLTRLGQQNLAGRRELLAREREDPLGGSKCGCAALADLLGHPQRPGAAILVGPGDQADPCSLASVDLAAGANTPPRPAAPPPPPHPRLPRHPPHPP